MSTNPYAAPKAPVADAAPALPQGEFVPGGRGVPIGHGWDWIAGGWELFKKQPGIWVLLVIVYLAIFIGLSFIPFAGVLATSLLWPVFGGGTMVGCRTQEGGGSLEVGHLFAGFREKFGTLAAVGAIYLAIYVAVALVVGLITGVDLSALFGAEPDTDADFDVMPFLLAMLLIAAALLPVMMALWFAPALVLFHGRGALEAMKESFLGCLKNVLPFLLYGVLFFIFAIPATLPVMLGWLVLMPVAIASMYASYRDIYFNS